MQYVLDLAIAGDQGIHILQIRNRVLVEWEKLKFPDCKKNYVELLNNLVGNGMARFKTDSERLLSGIKVTCSKEISRTFDHFLVAFTQPNIFVFKLDLVKLPSWGASYI